MTPRPFALLPQFLRTSTLTLFGMLALGRTLPAQSTVVRVDPRVELISLVARLAGYDEYRQCQYPAYERALSEWFESAATDPVVELARLARANAGIGFDAVQSLAIHLEADSLATGRAVLRPDLGALDPRWQRTDLPAFTAALDGFVRRARFMEFIAAHSALAAPVRGRLEAFVDAQIDFSWFTRFFGESGARFVIVPGLCNGVGNFGPRVGTGDGGYEYFAVMRVGSVDSSGTPRFLAQDAPIIVHEFSHSHVNPLLSAAADQFAPVIAPIYESLIEEMRAQSYGDAQTMLNESLVRAAVVRYLAATRSAAAAENEVRTQQGLGFLWMDELDVLLQQYESDRATYPTFASFVPRIEAFYRDLAPRLPTLLARFESRRPQLLSAEATPGSDRARPTRGVLRLRFDRPMRSGYSMNVTPSRESAYPKVHGRAMWDSTRTVVTFEVDVEPGQRFAFTLTGAGFASAEGAPLRRRAVEVTAGR